MRFLLFFSLLTAGFISAVDQDTLYESVAIAKALIAENKYDKLSCSYSFYQINDRSISETTVYFKPLKSSKSKSSSALYALELIDKLNKQITSEKLVPLFAFMQEEEIDAFKAIAQEIDQKGTLERRIEFLIQHYSEDSYELWES